MSEFLTNQQLEIEARPGDRAAYFNDHTFDPNLTAEELESLQEDLGAVAAELWDIPGANWQELEAHGGYEGYIRDIETIAKSSAPEKYGQTIEAGEKATRDYALKNGLETKEVSGFTAFRYNSTGDVEVLLSKTKNKPWTHQPHGGGRIEGEGAAAAVVREGCEEAGRAAGIAIVKGLKAGTMTYASYYASRLGNNNKLLVIYSFEAQGEVFEDVEFKPGSDSEAAVWLPVNDLPVDFVTTAQCDYRLRELGAEFPVSAFTQPNGNDGVIPAN